MSDIDYDYDRSGKMELIHGGGGITLQWNCPGTHKEFGACGIRVSYGPMSSAQAMVIYDKWKGRGPQCIGCVRLREKALEGTDTSSPVRKHVDRAHRAAYRELDRVKLGRYLKKLRGWKNGVRATSGA